ncbi:MAG: response regulator transcription factor [Planctomycetota bacterium]|nr:response regulator transcription factor [Planctomycetota bacterium]
MSRIRVLLADDHADLADHAAALMAERFDVVGTAEDGEAAVADCHELRPDVVVLDVAMPKLNGLDALRRILADRPATCVVMLSVHDEPEYVDAALAAGAKGYVFKGSMGGDLVGAVEEALKGRVFVSRRAPPGHGSRPPGGRR